MREGLINTVELAVDYNLQVGQEELLMYEEVLKNTGEFRELERSDMKDFQKIVRNNAIITNKDCALSFGVKNPSKETEISLIKSGFLVEIIENGICIRQRYEVNHER